MRVHPPALAAALPFVISLFSLPGFSQTVQKITFDATDSTNGYYLAVRPRSNHIKGALVLINSFSSPEQLLPETRLHNVAYANDLLTVFVSMGKKLYADAAALARINAVAQSLYASFAVDTGRIVLAGYDFAGNIALRYTELANEEPSAYQLHPKAVFAVDTPVDLFGLWNWCDRQIRKNYYQGTVGDAKYIRDMMIQEIGGIGEKQDTYKRLTAFYKDSPTAGNERFLAGTPVRLYYDTDIEWQLANRRNGFYDTNIPDGAELVNRLLLMGSTKAQFVSSKRPGVRSNGQRNPNSLSIVDEVDCIHWVKQSLDIFDPITWKSPYVLPGPDGWGKERFALPPAFAAGFSYKGVEEIRFHPDWAKAGSEGYWSYVYLWWLEGDLVPDAGTLQQNIQSYYAGLVGSNIGPMHIPSEKIVPTVVTLKKVQTSGADQSTFYGTVSMLDYMTQRPIALHIAIHVKDQPAKGKTALFIEASPQPAGHAIWKKLDGIGERLEWTSAP